MNLLIIKDGSIIKDEDGILQEVARFYCHLFQTQGNSKVTQQARAKLLKYTIARVTPAQRKKSVNIPTRGELKAILMQMSKEMSPSLDGMMTKVLLACQSFITQDCLEMVNHCWSTEELLHNITIGVMKVIPRKAKKTCLRDLWPLTMFTIVYKLIATTLFNRVSLVTNNIKGIHTGQINTQKYFFGIDDSGMGDQISKTNSLPTRFVEGF